MMNETEEFFGIDFGTTCCAMVNNSLNNSTKKYSLIEYGDDNGKPIPSVVAIDKNTGEVYTGRAAWRKKNELTDSCEVFSSIKTVIDSQRGRYIGDKYWTPVDIASEIFKALKKEAQKEKSDLSEATVAIPVGFSAKKRKNLREAARCAGIEITSFISEPTAAFFANYDELKSASVVAVFDWGGGTLDVSVMQNDNGKITELATGGQNVAGDAIDEKIARRIYAKIARKKGYTQSFDELDSKEKDKLLINAETAKIELGEEEEADVIFFFDGKMIKETLEYDWFEDIVAPEVEMALNCLEKTINQSGLNMANIDRILLVGGSSNLRPLLWKMEEKYGDKLYCPEKTEWNVGEGAAKLMSHPGEYYSAQSVGVVLADKIIEEKNERHEKEYKILESHLEMLAKGTPLKDWKKTFHFGIVDTSKEAQFIFCGSEDINELQDRYKTLTIDAYSFLQEKIIAEASVDKDGIFSVTAYSSMRPKEKHRIWEYTQLKTIYVLPKV